MSELNFTTLRFEKDDVERYRLVREFPVQRKYHDTIALIESAEENQASAHKMLTGENFPVELPRTLSIILRQMEDDDYMRYTLCDTMKKLYDDDVRNKATASDSIVAVARERIVEAAESRFLRVDELGGKHAVKHVRRVLRACEAAERGAAVSPRVALYLAATLNTAADYFIVRDYTRRCEIYLHGGSKPVREAELRRFVSRFLKASEETRRRVVETALCISWQ